MKKKMRIAIYVRISLKRQKEKRQLTDLRRFCKEKGWDCCVEFVDKDKRGWSKSRPAMNELRDRVANGEFDIVLVWSFDRASRDTAFSIELLEEFKKYKTAFYSFTQRIDTSDPMGRYMYISIANDAELETAKISARVKSGMNSARTEGKHLGRPVKICQKKVLHLNRKGNDPEEIASKLGCSSRYIRRILKQNAA